MVSASPPRSRLRRQRGVTQTVTARAVNIAWQAGVSEVSNVPRYNIADGWRSRCAPQAIFALNNPLWWSDGYKITFRGEGLE